MKNKTIIAAVLLAMFLLLAGCGGGGDQGTSTGGAAGDNGAKLKTTADLKDKRIGVLLGSVHDGYVTRTYPQAQLFQYKSASDVTLAVKTGKVDAAFYNRETLYGIIKDDKELAFLDECVYTIPVGIGFNKENGALRDKFNAFLKQIRANGVYDDMVNRWVTNNATDMPVIDNPNPNGVLVVGMVSDKGLPFAIIKDNKIVGFDVELSARFAAYLGKELKIVDTEFGSLVAAVSTNKVDLVASTLIITEERKRRIDFSDSYYELGASTFALKRNIAKYEGQSGVEADESFIKRMYDRFQSNIIQEKRYLLILDGLKTTALIALLATVFGTLLGALVCFLRMSQNRFAVIAAKSYINVIRGVPVLVLLMIIFYIVFGSVDIDPVLVAVLAFGMNFAAYVSEMFRTSIESIDKGQTEAGIAIGFTKTQTFFHIIMPQAMRRALPIYKGEFISLVRMTSIVGYIAVQDLTKAGDIIRSRTFDAFFPLIMVAVLYFFVSWLLALALDYMELRADPKRNRKPGRVANDKN